MLKKILLLLSFSSCSLYLSGQALGLDSLKEELTKTSDDLERLNLLREIASRLKDFNPSETFLYTREAIPLAQKLGLKEEEAKANYQMGLAYHITGKQDSGIFHCEQALQLTDETITLAKTYNVLGRVYAKKGNGEKALFHYFESIRLADQIDYKVGLAYVYQNLGNYFEEEEEDLVKAEFYTSKFLQLAIEMDDELNQAMAYNNLSIYYCKRENLDTAIMYLQKALPVFQKLNNQMGVATVINNLGSNQRLKKNYRQAIGFLHRARILWEEMEFKPGLVYNYADLGAAYGYLGIMDSCYYFFEKGETLGLETDVKPALMFLYEARSTMHEERKNMSSALKYFKLLSAINDSIFNEEKLKQVREVETKYETEKNLAQLAQQDLIISKQGNRQKNITILGIFALLLVSGIFQYLRYRNRIKRKETEVALQLKRSEAEKLKELGQLKSRFFANISHEFRTPLTLILGPLKQLEDSLPPSSKGEGRLLSVNSKVVSMMRRNSERLLQLINQILDLSKLERGEIKLQVVETDLVKFAKSFAGSFEGLAERKGIHYHTHFPKNNSAGFVDLDKVQKILSNLLSNAFKFTRENGVISLSFSCQNDRLRMEVEDSGDGIPKAELDHIFDRFYQVEGTKDGTGIGLSYVKELVENHKGQISVSSEIGQGTTFRVSLPVNRTSYGEDEILQEAIEFVDQATTSNTEMADLITPVEEKDFASEVPVVTESETLILLVEDNADLRTYMKTTLSEIYNVMEAANGRIGLEMATEHLPDLIVSDIMMPKMSGTELCNKIKTDQRTSHIPLILLTAKAGQKNKLEGLSTGADDYLTKPFDVAELKVRIKNLIVQRRQLRQRFSGAITLKPEEIAVTPADEVFLTTVKDTIENNIPNENFGVEDLSQAVNMSKSQTNRKLKAILGQSPNQLIRNMRLNRAKEMLEAKVGTISEICFEVGFNSLAYFSKCFADQFGLPPSEVREGASS